MGRDLNQLLRPKTWEDVVGQASVRYYIQTNLKNGTYPKITMFEGASGIGKSTLAEIVATYLTGGNPELYKKINMATISSKADMNDIVKEIFTLAPSTRHNSVYIFEEVHTLTKDNQNILLEEMSNILEGVFVIMCTSQPRALIPALSGRATPFRLKQPSLQDCLTLAERCFNYLEMKPPKKKVLEHIVKYSKYTPRVIVNTIGVLAVDDKLNEDLAYEMMGYVQSEYYVSLMEHAGSNMYAFHRHVMTAENQPLEIVRGLKSFFVDIIDFIYGENKTTFTVAQRKRLSEVFQHKTENEILELATLTKNLPHGDDEEAMLSLVEFKLCFNQKTKAQVIVETKKEATLATIESEKKSKQEVNHTSAVPLTMDSINSILSSNTIRK